MIRTFLISACLIALAPRVAFAQFVQQGPKLVDNGAFIIAEQGFAVAISADGNTAVVGGPVGGVDMGSPPGAVWIYTRRGGIWTQQGPKLVPDQASSGADFGLSVAISGDGNTIIVGGVNDDNLNGGAWIFVRNNGVWTQQGQKLLGSGASARASQGWSVALSGDGNTALVSSSFDDMFTGATWVFVRDAGVWSQQGPKLIGTGAGPNTGGHVEPWQGWQVALSADGKTALIGGSRDSDNAGAAWVFTRSGSTWTQQGAKLTPSDASGFATFGEAVSLSADGNVAAIGGSGDSSNVGAAWIFTRTGSTWSQQGPKLVGTGAVGSSFQGRSVSLSGNGATLLVSGPEPDTSGASFVFRRTASGWSQVGNKLVGTGAVGHSQQGQSSALSSDGRTIIAGGWNDNGSLGAAWIFRATNDALRAGDTDGDGQSDITVYNTTSGVWSTLTSTTGYTGATNIGWGGTNYAPVPGDYDGDGKADLGLYDISTGYWYVLLSGSNFTTTLSKSAGGPGWQAVPGDYDGDGKTDFVVYNFITGLWAILLSSTNYTTSLSAYCGGDVWTPVPADYDGDGKTDLVVYDFNAGQWYGLESSGNYTTTLNVLWGGLTYRPVKGDYDGDGKADFAVYVANTSMWYILLSGANYTTSIARSWGGPGYAAVPRFP